MRKLIACVMIAVAMIGMTGCDFDPKQPATITVYSDSGEVINEWKGNMFIQYQSNECVTFVLNGQLITATGDNIVVAVG